MVATSMGTYLTGRETSFSKVETFGASSHLLGDLQREGSVGKEWVAVGLVLRPPWFMVERIQFYNNFGH